MAHPYHHAVSSAKRFGGQPEDYLALHSWFDATKAHLADARHRVLRHHSFGIFVAEQKFGVTLTNSSGNRIPTRAVGEQHVQEDFSFIPSVQQCFKRLPVEAWPQTNYQDDTPSRHARESAEQFGGNAQTYLPVHVFLESSRLHLSDARHRALLHTTLGVQTVEEVFGLELTGVPTRLIAEAHIGADLGFMPTVEEALDGLPLEPWMFRGAQTLTRRRGRRIPTPLSEPSAQE